jgi:glutamate/tyrosine decarboxylase-like PLP-dependent enzyme
VTTSATDPTAPSASSASPAGALALDRDARARLWHALVLAIEAYAADVPRLRVEPIDAKDDPTPFLEATFDFTGARDPVDVLSRVVECLRKYQVHTPHPGYFGLFNPWPTPMGIAADALVAAFNPQLATFSHSPFAVAAERHLIRALGARLGFTRGAADGTFASGGAEANHTALLVALAERFPDVRARGLRSLPAQPTVYTTSETHHSIVKAAIGAGLGAYAVREVPVDARLAMDPVALSARLDEDAKAGMVPFLVVGTAGTTSSGVIDPLAAIAGVAAAHGLWFHVDAAWGGAAALVPELAPAVAGIAHADSITFDAHKWLSVPMGAGIFLTPHEGALDRTFAVAASYMPHRLASAPDPYARSMQWSRRFIGLKVLMSLAVAGWDGYAAAIRHQTAMGELLRARLRAAQYEVVNETPLPLVCFVDSARTDGGTAGYLARARNVVGSAGDAWISVARLGAARRPVLRACITNANTAPVDLDRLVDRLRQARAGIGPQIGE